MTKVAVLFSRDKYPELTSCLSLLPVKTEFPGHHYTVTDETPESFSALISDETLHIENLRNIIRLRIPAIVITPFEDLPFHADFIKTCPPSGGFALLNKIFQELSLPFFEKPTEGKDVDREDVFQVFLYMWQNALTGLVQLASDVGEVSVPVYMGQVSLARGGDEDPFTLLSTMSKVLASKRINYEVKPLKKASLIILESWPSFLSRLSWSMGIDEINADLKDVEIEPGDMNVLWVLPLKAGEMAFLTSLVPGQNYLDVAREKGVDENTALRLLWTAVNLNIFKPVALSKSEVKVKKAGLPEPVTEEAERKTYSNGDFEVLDLDEQ